MSEPRQASVPVSYAGRDSIHFHGGVIYRGRELPSGEQVRTWARRLEEQATGYLEGLEQVEHRALFHLTLDDEDPPGFEIRAEVHAVLGPRSR